MMTQNERPSPTIIPMMDSLNLKEGSSSTAGDRLLMAQSLPMPRAPFLHSRDAYKVKLQSIPAFSLTEAAMEEDEGSLLGSSLMHGNSGVGGSLGGFMKHRSLSQSVPTYAYNTSYLMSGCGGRESGGMAGFTPEDYSYDNGLARVSPNDMKDADALQRHQEDDNSLENQGSSISRSLTAFDMLHSPEMSLGVRLNKEQLKMMRQSVDKVKDEMREAARMTDVVPLTEHEVDEEMVSDRESGGDENDSCGYAADEPFAFEL
mmetsp:Transcript_10418/g.13548  ORF Transcript_10418/g.13548 Transcript_10418/m.13548 type:complete len:261 (+) Transcript_10418:164-946(+)